MEKLRMFKVNPANRLPKKQTEQSACFDLMFQGYGKSHYNGYSKSNKPFQRVMNNLIVVQPGDRIAVPTGVIMDIPEGYSVRLHARSGMSLKQGLVLANAEGVIDADYVEEVMVLVNNISDNAIELRTGDRIAQGELVKDVEYTIEETAVRFRQKTSRAGGMGSTGITDSDGTITLNIPEPKAKEIVTDQPVKRGRGRPRKYA